METNAFHKMKYVFKLLTWNIWLTFNLEILWNSTHQGIPNKLCDFLHIQQEIDSMYLIWRFVYRYDQRSFFFYIYGCIVILH